MSPSCPPLNGEVSNKSYPYKGRQYTFKHYLHSNFLITTSGMFDTAALVHLLDVMTPERVMFSVDSPFEDVLEATAWFRSIHKERPEISCESLQAIAYGNAEKLAQWMRR